MKTQTTTTRNQVVVTVDEEMKSQLKDLAQRHNTSVSHLARLTLTKLLEANPAA